MDNLNFDDLLRKLTEWGLVLREVSEDRDSMGLLENQTTTNCVCPKAQVYFNPRILPMSTTLYQIHPKEQQALRMVPSLYQGLLTML
jgi:hypothetical protein